MLIDDILILLGIFLFVVLLDGVYLYSNRKYFKHLFEKVQASSFKFKYLGGILAYIAIVSLLYIFVILQNLSYTETFLLGFLTYGLYHSTNYATLRRWSTQLMLIDSLWGGVLFFVTYFFYNNLLKY